MKLDKESLSKSVQCVLVRTMMHNKKRSYKFLQIFTFPCENNQKQLTYLCIHDFLDFVFSFPLTPETSNDVVNRNVCSTALTFVLMNRTKGVHC